MDVKANISTCADAPLPTFHNSYIKAKRTNKEPARKYLFPNR